VAQIDEIARDIYRISIHVPQFDLQFNHFLVRDEEPLLFHTGMRGMFPEMREAVGRLIDPASLRWISWSHFEVDECGALNEWLAVAPHATPACGQVGAMVNLQDFSNRAPRALAPGDALNTGRHTFRWIPTPHLPHGWDAGVLFEERDRVLFCSDLFHQLGPREPITRDDIVSRYEQAVVTYQAHPVLMDYMPFTPITRRHFEKLASLEPRLLAAMHGSSFEGDGASALRSAADLLERVLGAPPAREQGGHPGARPSLVAS
jgi:flavorubredoxin